jgi:hypothetical protein
MTKKDYELIANELKSQHELLGYNGGLIEGNGDNTTITVYEASCKLWAQTLATANPLFNKAMFLKACGIEV